MSKTTPRDLLNQQLNVSLYSAKRFDKTSREIIRLVKRILRLIEGKRRKR
jgi:hypothetical protein